MSGGNCNTKTTDERNYNEHIMTTYVSEDCQVFFLYAQNRYTDNNNILLLVSLYIRSLGHLWKLLVPVIFVQF
jgi:hypothetical protein